MKCSGKWAAKLQFQASTSKGAPGANNQSAACAWVWRLASDTSLSLAVRIWSFPLRFAEKPTRINVASKAARRHAPQIVNASCVRAVVKAGPSRPPCIWITTRRRRAILCSLILLDDPTGQRASSGSCGCANRRATDITGRCGADDRASGSAPSCALAGRRVAGT